MDQSNDLMGKLKVAGIVLVSLLSLFVLVKIITELKALPYVGKSDQYTGTITVSGKGEIVAVPDVATFNFGVTEENMVVATAQDNATKKVNAIINFLKQSGVADTDIKTVNYNIYPRYEYQTQAIDLPVYYPSSGKQVLAAYVVSQTIEVKVRKTEDAGKLISGIEGLGATDISGLNFSVDKYDDLVKQAREKAIEEARANAEKLSNELGVSLVRITSYYDQGNYPVYYDKAMNFGVAEGRGGGDVMAPSLPVGENKIISNVSITYEIR